MSKSAPASKLASIAQDYKLDAIYAFGSRALEALAKANAQDMVPSQSNSDLDIGILPSKNKKLTIDEIVQIGLALETLFDVSRVDVVVLPEASPFLALEIVRGELLFASDLDKEANYQLYALRRACDLASWERERRQLLLDGEAL